MIFDEFERFDDSPKLNIESDFKFLNRSSRVEMHRARQFLEVLISKYPEANDLIARIRSGNNNNYRSAEFELLLFGALLNQGFSLIPHPILENGSKSRPDFLVISPSGEEFYLEAVLAREDSQDQTQHPLIATTLDIFTLYSHQNFGVMVSTSNHPSTQPSGKQLLSQTMKWLDSLNPDEVQVSIDANGYDASPTMEWTHEQFTITLKAVPLRAERRGKADRLLVVQFGQVGYVDSWSPIKDAIRFKGTKYGQLDKPLVIAVNFLGRHLDSSNEMQALFGQDQIVLSTTNTDAEPIFERAMNGAWISEGGPVFTRVSAAWIFDGLCTYNISKSSPTLYLHPWARYPITGSLLQFRHANGNDDVMTWQEGVHLRQVFGLPEGWPGEF